jgi:succinate dehydrogenase / fumarate reductase membrane anchor subunit
VAVDARTTGAARPRTLREARSAYATNSELAWWVFMRISGFLLVFLVFAHVFVNNIVTNAGTIDYDYVAERLAQPAVRVMDSFLLGLALLHGTNGLRYVVDDHIRRPQARFWVKAVLYTAVFAVFVVGVMTLWTYTFDEMGEAVRNLGQ